jgi:deoxycytidine triphosphate deaminase
MKLDIDDGRALRISPLLSPLDQIGEDAVDIRLGTHFLVPRSERRGTFVPGVTSGHEVAHRMHFPPGRRFVLPGKAVVLASAFEFIKMPCDVAAQVLTRSSIGRIFVTTATATLVHPSYRGCLTLEIVNLGNATVELDILSRIAQLQFLSTSQQPSTAVADHITGRYAASIEPEFPDFTVDEREYTILRGFAPRGNSENTQKA